MGQTGFTWILQATNLMTKTTCASGHSQCTSFYPRDSCTPGRAKHTAHFLDEVMGLSRLWTRLKPHTRPVGEPGPQPGPELRSLLQKGTNVGDGGSLSSLGKPTRKGKRFFLLIFLLWFCLLHSLLCSPSIQKESRQRVSHIGGWESRQPVQPCSPPPSAAPAPFRPSPSHWLLVSATRLPKPPSLLQRPGKSVGPPATPSSEGPQTSPVVWRGRSGPGPQRTQKGGRKGRKMEEHEAGGR